MIFQRGQTRWDYERWARGNPGYGGNWGPTRTACRTSRRWRPLPGRGADEYRGGQAAPLVAGARAPATGLLFPRAFLSPAVAAGPGTRLEPDGKRSKRLNRQEGFRRPPSDRETIPPRPPGSGAGPPGALPASGGMRARGPKPFGGTWTWPGGVFVHPKDFSSRGASGRGRCREYRGGGGGQARARFRHVRDRAPRAGPRRGAEIHPVAAARRFQTTPAGCFQAVRAVGPGPGGCSAGPGGITCGGKGTCPGRSGGGNLGQGTTSRSTFPVTESKAGPRCRFGGAPPRSNCANPAPMGSGREVVALLLRSGPGALPPTTFEGAGPGFHSASNDAGGP